MVCKTGVVQPLDLTPWKELQPQIHISAKLLSDTFKRAKRDLMDVRNQEWQLYKES